MRAAKAFTKGQLVTLIGSWDEQGTAYYRDAVVYSCGAKQMVLTDEATGEEIGRHFKPAVGDFDNGGTFPRMTQEEAEAACLVVGTNVVVRQRAHYASRRVQFGGSCRFYDAGLNESEAKLHEPRAIRHPNQK